MFDNTIIKLNNFATRARKAQCPAENILLLLPRCIQWSKCSQDVVADIENCKVCGQCPLTELFKLKQKYGVQCLVAGGGRQAVAAVKRKDVKAIIAVACTKELSAGIIATLPKPVIAIKNTQPCGFCNNTQVEIEKVEEAIKRIVR